ncbi:hypothetical protein GCM10010981_41390 [Dyella nitratireducens]|uniref:Uncharacterized protein n=1 Tax=Dyella nitratireducens TaxID=1849580 RepID=A0ABQ1GPJ1_9GAMM|nr:hypothetical protein GCM10010981_41390 [Dyella nitratireducens]GLQ42383.1 hypothetical protein GCM10007902_22330 [Dyella nitratireducens]
MQTPVRDARNYRLARELGAMEKEQQRDRQIGQPIECHGRTTLARQHAGGDDRGNQAKGEVVGQEATQGHGCRHREAGMALFHRAPIDKSNNFIVFIDT